MSNWEPVKIRDTPRFSTVTLLIGLRSRYLPLASGTSRRRNQGCLLGCAAGICLDRASGGDENYSNWPFLPTFESVWGLIPPIAFEPFDRPRRLIIGNYPPGD